MNIYFYISNHKTSLDGLVTWHLISQIRQKGKNFRFNLDISCSVLDISTVIMNIRQTENLTKMLVGIIRYLLI